MASLQRVSVFIDSENLYWDGRRAFHKNAGPASFGQIDPRKYAELLVARGPAGAARQLNQIHVYVGVPGSSQQPAAYAARRRQIAAWRKDGISVFDRPLRYPGDWPMSKPQEKGIDVALAVGLVFGAARRGASTTSASLHQRIPIWFPHLKPFVISTARGVRQRLKSRHGVRITRDCG